MKEKVTHCLSLSHSYSIITACVLYLAAWPAQVTNLSGCTDLLSRINTVNNTAVLCIMHVIILNFCDVVMTYCLTVLRIVLKAPKPNQKSQRW